MSDNVVPHPHRYLMAEAEHEREVADSPEAPIYLGAIEGLGFSRNGPFVVSRLAPVHGHVRRLFEESDSWFGQVRLTGGLSSLGVRFWSRARGKGPPNG
jgi:hypothetical protein